RGEHHHLFRGARLSDAGRGRCVQPRRTRLRRRPAQQRLPGQSGCSDGLVSIPEVKPNMDLLSLFSNSALMRRFLQYAALIPIIVRFIEHVEATQQGDPGPEKRATVLKAVTTNVDELIRRQILPPDIREDLDKTAGELIDTTVNTYNT